MEIVFREMFLYLALVYVINGLLTNLLRKLRIGDFIANVGTGVLLGLLLMVWQDFFPALQVPNFAGNRVIVFIAQLGLLLFMIQLGFNMDFRFFRELNRDWVIRAIILMLANVLLISGLCYFTFGITDPWTILLITTGFIGINAGAALANNFPVAGVKKRPLTNLIQMAILMDVFVVALFSIFSLFRKIGSYQVENLTLDITFGIFVALFLVPVFIPGVIASVFRRLETLIGDYFMALKVGMFCLFLYFGMQIGLSVFLLGVWAGVLFRLFSGSGRTEIENKFFPVASFLYILPFVEIGRRLVSSSDLATFDLFNLFATLAALGVSTILMILLELRKKVFSIHIGLTVFARGELTMLILWLSTLMVQIPYPIFAGMAGAVIISSIAVRAVMSGQFRSKEEPFAHDEA